jgi:hypothetical protein
MKDNHLEPQPNQVLSRDNSLISRQIRGETILAPVRKNVGDLDSIYTLNETASRTWELIDGLHTLEEIHAQLVLEYEVEPGQAWQDLSELMSKLQDIGAVSGL